MPHPSIESENPVAGAKDLGPLVWVLNDLRQSIPMATMALCRAAKESRSAARMGEGWPDDSSLLAAQHQFEQAAGALAIVGQLEAAKICAAAKAATAVFIQKPAACTEEAAASIHRAGQAVINFLQARLSGYDYSAVALFPSYREILPISGAQHFHPADLWQPTWRWQILPRPTLPAAVMQWAVDNMGEFDSALLGCIRSADPASAHALTGVCSALAQRSSDERHNSYWHIAAGFFEAVSLKLLVHTVEIKRTMADIRGSLMRQHTGVNDLKRHAREMVFFCACARRQPDSQAPHLQAVRTGYGLDGTPDIDYQTDIFSNRDPKKWAALHQKLGTLIESWTAVAVGQKPQIPAMMAQLANLTTVASQVAPVSGELLQELMDYLHTLTQTGHLPTGTLTMEVAIALLTVEAACEDPYAAGDQLERRCQQLTARLRQARQHGQFEALDDWMLKVFRHGARQRSISSLVSELGKVLQAVENCLERYFSDADDARSLTLALENLEQADGIFAMLGLEQAHLATQHLRGQIASSGQQTTQSGHTPLATQTLWAANLGALGVLTDALAFQPALAKELFYFDAAAGQLLSGVLPIRPSPAPAPALGAGEPIKVPHTVGPVPEAVVADDTDAEIMAIFFGEMRQILAQTEQTIAQAVDRPDADAQTEGIRTVRRAFHTLKGGARMVGLDELGEAAWAFEQLCNASIAQERDLRPHVLPLSHQALLCFREWIEAIEQGQPVTWLAGQFRDSADALRLQGIMQPLRNDLRRSDPMAKPAARAYREIGTLRLSEKLFQVFTAEAADRIALLGQLAQQVTAPAQPDPEHVQSIQNLLHALHGSAATVGFSGLAALAHAAEHALQRAVPGSSAQVLLALQPCVAAMERLMQRFADGYLDEAPPEVLYALQRLEPGVAPPPPAPEAQADALDTDLWPTFREEGGELLPALDQAMRLWVAQPESTTHADPVRRLLHTLKGSARSAGAAQLGEMAHGLETYLSTKPDTLTAHAWLSTALEYLDTMRAHFDGLQPTGLAASTPPQLTQLQTPSNNASLQHARPTVRVGAEHLDRVLSQCSELLVVRSRMQSRAGEMLATLDQLAGNASRLREQLRALEMQTELQMQSRPTTADADTARLDPLELDRFTRLQEISRMMAESSEDLGALNKILRDGMSDLDRDLVLQKRQGQALQQEILDMRLVAFDWVSDRLYVAVRQAAKHAGRIVRLDITGSGTSVDRSMLERLAPCLEHLVRNAVVHGIETASERLAAGKSPTGEIRVNVNQVGQQIHIQVRDDGAGLRKDRIRSKAIGAGLLAHDAALSDDDAIALLLRSGFSTSEGLDMFSGRGVGMDVVQSEVRGMGGHLAIESQVGHGLCFAMVFPISTGLTQVVLFRAGDMTFGVPRSMLLEVLERPALPALQAATTLQRAGHGEVDLFWAGDLLEGPDPDLSLARERDTIAVFGNPGAIVALQVTQALGEREMAVKDLGPPFATLPALVTASVLPTGDLVLIYNPLELARAYGKPARRRHLARVGRINQPSDNAAQNPTENPHKATILVVDDSITVRRVTQRLLTREGMHVVLAHNGLDALDKMKTLRPDLILSDIEMPHMDGFDLARAVRADPRNADIPFIVISSRVGDKHRDIAQSLGVNHYLGKPYSEPALLALVRTYFPEKALA